MIRRSNIRNLIILILVLSLVGLTSCQKAEMMPSPTQEEPTPAISSPTADPPTEIPSSTPAPSETPIPTPTFDIQSVADWGAGSLVFSLEEHGFGEKSIQGIFELDLSTGTINAVSGQGKLLQDTSPDHLRLLAADKSALIILDFQRGSEETLVTDFYELSPSGAKWDHTNNLIYYLGSDGSEIYLVKFDPENQEGEHLPVESPIAILEAESGSIILGTGSCNPFGNCVYTGLVWITDQGAEINSATLDDSLLLPCQTGSDYVYAVEAENGSQSLHIRPHDQDLEKVFWVLDKEYADCTWSPDKTRLAVIVIDRFWYSGSIQEYYFQLLDPNTNEVNDRSYMNAPLDHLSWSPDGRYVGFSGTDQNEDAYQFEINVMDMKNFSVTKYYQFELFKSENYLTVPKLLWVP